MRMSMSLRSICFVFAVAITAFMAASCSGPEKEAAAPKEKTAFTLPDEKSLPATSGIGWLEWGEKAFDKAVAGNRAILLYVNDEFSLEARTTEKNFFDNPEVAEKIKGYVPVRVYNRSLPYVEECYGTGLKVISQEGIIIADVDVHDVSSLPASSEIDGNVVGDKCPVVTAKLKKQQKEPAKKDELKKFLNKEIKDFDPDTIRLPATDRIMYYLIAARITKEDIYKKLADEMTEKLDNILDTQWGGVFDGPKNYEKHLETNAAAIDASVMYAGATGGKTAIAAEAVRYIGDFLSGAGGGIFGGQADGMESGGKTISGKDFFTKWGGERDKFGMPERDRNIYTVSNSMYAGAMFRAADFYNRPAWRKRALKTAQWLREKQFDEVRGAPVFVDDNRGSAYGLLKSNTYLLRAYLDTYSGTGDSAWLERARKLAAFIEQKFGDPDNGGYFYGDTGDGITGETLAKYKPLEGNSVMAAELVRLYYITLREEYLERAAAALGAVRGRVADTKRIKANEYFQYIRAAYAFSFYPLNIAVVGPVDDAATQELRRQAARFYEPNKVLMVLAPGRDKALFEVHPYSPRPEPTMFACVGTACSMPVDDPQNVQNHLKQFVDRYMDDDDGGLLKLQKLQ